jgi:hypothetical protein
MASGISTRRLLVLYSAVSAVYLCYLPQALPVLDDWTILRIFHQARHSGAGRAAGFVVDLATNAWWGQFRIFWTSFVPVYLLSFFSDFHAWPYSLLAWIAHLLAAVLLCRIVSMLSGNPWSGFAAGAVYAVFPAANNALFWPLGNYYFQALALLYWFDYTWRKLAAAPDCRYRWKDLGLLAGVVFTGEQIIPALLFLLPVTDRLFGKPENRSAVRRFWAWHLAASCGLLGLYIGWINRMPVLRNFEIRYGGAGRWSPWPFVSRLLASLGLHPALAEWRPRWHADPVLLMLLAPAVAAFLCGARMCCGASASRSARLLLWSLAGIALTYVSVAPLPGVEWRYLYVPSAFLVTAGIAVLGFFGRRAGAAFVLLAISYGLSLSYFEMRQCWIPQSREARAVLDAVAAAAPVRPREIFLFAHAPHSIGPAPSFLLGASWSLNNMLEHYTGAAQIQGARELLVNQRGELALYRRDSLAPFTRDDIPRLRVFVRDAGGRFTPRPFLALPTGTGRRYELFPLSGAGQKTAAPPGGLTLEELQRLPVFKEIYFAHPFNGALPHA